jgi:Icc protein
MIRVLLKLTFHRIAGLFSRDNNGKFTRHYFTRYNKLFFCLSLTLGVASCSLFEYHPYETNLDKDNRNLNAKAIGQLIASPPTGDTLTIILMGDTQRFYDEVEDFVTSANRQSADLVFLDGDITDFGLKDEYEWVHEIMGRLNKPYLAVIGNHDLSGNGEEVFKKMYGPLNSSFVVNRFKFILLNTNSREYKFNGHVPDIPWLEQQLTGDDFDQAVVVSHIPSYDGDFDPALEEAYASALRNSGKVKLSLHGHKHSYHNTIPYDDGIRYVVSTSMDDRMYLIIKMWDDQYSIKELYY